MAEEGPARSARSTGGEVAPRLRGARLEGLLPFHLKQRHHQAFRSFLFLFLRLNFGSSLPGAGVGGGGRNTFFSTIFNLLLFIKLSSSFGGLKQTWTLFFPLIFIYLFLFSPNQVMPLKQRLGPFFPLIFTYLFICIYFFIWAGS